ncbi:hypothetical protein TREES_T100000097 [Tupaia chinensis]|uniref:Uncharacterized protein n=1 Tax=Tupaia chinensis TaxID=246437 RepID=L9LDD8_TUPCH|nr:hypothetical protein TREES_T100000097 [Tupaia chinensis]
MPQPLLERKRRRYEKFQEQWTLLRCHHQELPGLSAVPKPELLELQNQEDTDIETGEAVGGSQRAPGAATERRHSQDKAGDVLPSAFLGKHCDIEEELGKQE